MVESQAFEDNHAGNNAQSEAVPCIVYGSDEDTSIRVDIHELTQTMRQLNISESGIAESTIYIDTKNRFQNFGTHYPNKFGRLRFRSIPEIQESTGDIIRLSTKMKGKARTPEQINTTLVHELEHLAQQDRHDKRLIVGHIAIWGLALIGATLGNRLVKNKVVGTAIGLGLGHSLGYVIAPHEVQARNRAGQGRRSVEQVTSTAIRR